MKYLRLSGLLLMLISFVSIEGKAHTVVVKSVVGTYFYNEQTDQGGCLLTGKCLDVVITDTQDIIETGDINNGDYSVELTPNATDPMTLNIYENDVVTETHDISRYEQTENGDGSLNIDYILY